MVWEKFQRAISKRTLSRRAQSRRIISQSRESKLKLSRRKIVGELLERREMLAGDINHAIGDELREYRLALATTAEFTSAVGGVGATQSLLNDFVGDLNEFFNREVAVNFSLVGGTSTFFTDTGSDGLTNGDVGQLLQEGTGVIDGAIGNASYDFGHVLGTFSGSGASGVNTLGNVGWDSIKGRGATVSGPSFIGTDGWFRVVAHEIGHGFGAEHTFNATGGNCDQREADTAYEPASGSTLMSYGGICGSGADFISSSEKDDMFHAASIEEINDLINRNPNGFQDPSPNSVTATGNSIPIVDATPNNGVTPTATTTPSVTNDTSPAHFFIPASTPFALEASSSDADGDLLTYSWEQFDLGPAQNLPLSGSVSDGPLFRTYEPTEGASRVFPNLNDLLAGNSTSSIGEVLPTVGRDMDFRVTVRDDNGGVNSDDIKLQVVDTGSAFAVDSLPSQVSGGSTQTITWDVAGTDSGSINASDVEIWLSTNGGFNFDTLLTTTTNDGSADVGLPNIDAASARIRVNPVGNVFFAINDANFEIVSSSTAPGVTVLAGELSVAEDGVIDGVSTATYQLKLNTVPASPVQLTVTVPSDIEVADGSGGFGSTLTLTLSDDSSQTITVRAIDDSLDESFETISINHAITSSSDPDYPTGLAVNPVDITVVDDELHPLVAVAFSNDGTNPTNWNESSVQFGGSESSLLREDGVTTSFGLTIDYQGAGNGLGSYTDPNVLPVHNPSLEDLNGLRFSTGTQDFDWTGLTPGAEYEVFVLVTENFGDTADQTVTITGDSSATPVSFDISTAGRNRQIHVNDQIPSASSSLREAAAVMTADASGEIQVSVVRNSGTYSYVSALAIGPVINESLPVPISVSNDDPGTQYLENGGQVNLTLTRGGDTTGPLTIDVSVDLAAELTFPSTVTFAAGAATTSFVANPVDDSDFESDENFTFTFGTAPTTETATFSGTILDDDPPLALSLTRLYSQVTEGINVQDFTVSRNGDTSAPLDVLLSDIADIDYYYVDGSVVDIETTVTIPAGQSSFAFRAAIVADGIDEVSPETVLVTATALGFPDASVTFDIIDADDAELGTLLSSSNIAEGDSATLTISRNTASDNPSFGDSVNVSLDYGNGQFSGPTQVTIPANAATVDVTIDAVSDGIVDGDVDGTISATANSFVGSSATGTAVDIDEFAVSVTPASVSVDEGGDLTLSVSIGSPSAVDTTVDLSLDDGSQASIPSNVVITAGQTSADVTLQGTADSVADGDAVVVVTASLAGVPNATANVTVIDVDLPELTVTIDMSAVTEGGAIATGTVARSGSVTSDLTVTLTTDSDSRLAIPASVVIPSGSSTVDFAVQANDDNVVNGDESIVVTASTKPAIAFDTTYGNAGAASVSAVENEFFYLPTFGEHLVQDDGKVVTTYNRQRHNFNIVRFNTDGSPDTTFGNGGIVNYDYEFFIGLDETPGDVVQLPNGKLVVSFVRGPNALSPPNKQYLLQLNTDGSIDTTYGDSGVVEVDASVWGSNSDLVALSDGSIVTVSTQRVSGVQTTYAKRILPNGTIDPNFDDSAIAALPQGSEIVALPDDSVLVLGRVYNGTSYEGHVVKLLPGGGADPSFGNSGVVVLSGPGNVFVDDAAVDGSGRIVLFGSRNDAAGDRNAEVTRLLADGSLDTSFGIGGFSNLPGESTTAFVDRGDVDSQGRILLAVQDTSVLQLIALDVDGNEVARSDGLVNNQFSYLVFDLDFDDQDRAYFSTYDSDYRVYRLGELDYEPTVSDDTSIDVLDDDEIELTLSLDGSQIGETETVSLTVGLVKTSITDTVVTLSSSDTGEATLPASVTIPAGQTEVDVTVSGVVDDFVDGDEVVSLDALSGTATATTSLTVVDQTPTVLSVSGVFDIDEDASSRTVTVGLSAATSVDTVVSLSVSDSSAVSVPSSITIPAFSTSAQFLLTPNNDNTLTGDRSVTLTASSDAYSGTNRTFVVVEDEVQSFTYSVSVNGVGQSGDPIDVNEGDQILIDVSAAYPAIESHSFRITRGGSQVDAGDSSGEFLTPKSIDSGDSAVSFTFSITDDNVDELTEELQVLLQKLGTAPTGAPTYLPVELYRFSINDDDTAVPVLAIVEESMLESETVSATLSISNPYHEDLTFDLVSSDTDQATVPATATITAGHTSVTFDVVGVDNAIDDGTNAVTVTATGVLGSISDSIDVVTDEAAVLTIVEPAPSVAEGDTATIQFELSAPFGVDTVVALATSNGEATIDGSVTIPAGQTVATATLTGVVDNLIDGDQSVTLTATAGSLSDTSTLTVFDIDVGAIVISLDETQFQEFAGTFMTVGLTTPASSDVEIFLTSSDETEATVPASVTISAGENDTRVRISGVEDNVVDGDQSTTISATSSGMASASESVTVLDSDTAILSLSVSDTTLSENGETATGTVTLSKAVLTQDVVVSLTNDDSTELTTPANVTILAGSTSADFTIAGEDDLIDDGDQTVTIQASSSFGSDTEAVTVTDDDEQVVTVEYLVNGVPLAGNDLAEGDSVEVNVSYAFATPTSKNVFIGFVTDAQTTTQTGDVSFDGSTLVTLASSDQTASFSFTVNDDTIDEISETFTVQVSQQPFQSPVEVIDTTQLNIVDNDTAVPTVQIFGSSLSENGGTLNGFVRLSNQFHEDLTFTLNNSSSTRVLVPGTVTIPAGNDSGSFTVQAINNSIDDGDQNVVITANGSIGSASDSFNVIDDDASVLSLSLSGSSVAEGNSLNGQVVLSTARNVDTVVALSSNDTSEATVPASVTVPAFQTTADFAISAETDAFVDGDQLVTLTASNADTGTALEVFAVTDIDVTSLTLSLNAPSVDEGQSATLTVSLSTVVGADTVIDLSSSDTSEATVPPSVTIPAGQSSATVTVTAQTDGLIDGDVVVTLTGSTAGLDDSAANLTVENIDVGTLSFSLADSSFSENGGITTGTVSIDVPSEDPIVLALSSSDLSEVAVPNSVTLQPGETSASFSVAAVDDIYFDGNRSATITVDGGTLGLLTDGIVSLDDEGGGFVAEYYVNDVFVPTNFLATLSVTEGDQIRLDLTLDHPREGNTEVGFVGLTGGDPKAFQTSDYVFTTPTVIDIGQDGTFASVTIDIIDDGISEPSETFFLNSRDTTGVVFDTLSQALVNIHDNDQPTIELSIDPSSVSENGGVAVGTVTLSHAYFTDLTIALQSSDDSSATVPLDVVIPAGQLSGIFDISGQDNAVDNPDAVVTITADNGFGVDLETITVLDDEVPQITLTTGLSTISELGNTTLTATLSVARTVATEITLSSSDTGEATLSSNVITIPAGQLSASTSVDGVSDNTVDGAQIVTLTALAIGISDSTTTLSVSDTDTFAVTTSVSALEMDETGSATLTVNIGTPAASDVTFDLTSSDTSEATLPSTVTVLAGQTNATVSISGVPDNLVDGNQSVTFEAFHQGVFSSSAAITVVDIDSASLSLSTADASIAEDGSTTLTVSVSTPFATDTLVNLSSSDTDEASVIGVLTIPAEQFSASVSVNGAVDGMIDGTQTVTLTAMTDGLANATTTLDVTDIDAGTIELSLANQSIAEDGSTTLTVTR